MEGTLNGLLEEEVAKLTQAARYERNESRQGYQAGEIISEYFPIGKSKDAYEFSADVMQLDLAEFGYKLTADGNAYEYHDSDENLSESMGEMKM